MESFSAGMGKGAAAAPGTVVQRARDRESYGDRIRRIKRERKAAEEARHKARTDPKLREERAAAQEKYEQVQKDRAKQFHRHRRAQLERQAAEVQPPPARQEEPVVPPAAHPPLNADPPQAEAAETANDPFAGMVALVPKSQRGGGIDWGGPRKIKKKRSRARKAPKKNLLEAASPIDILHRNGPPTAAAPLAHTASRSYGGTNHAYQYEGVEIHVHRDALGNATYAHVKDSFKARAGGVASQGASDPIHIGNLGNYGIPGNDTTNHGGSF